MRDEELKYLIGRETNLLATDIEKHSKTINELVANSSFLVVGAAGSIGQAVTLEIFNRMPKLLHAIDISENNLAEMVRNLRSSVGYIDGEFKTFCVDYGGPEFALLFSEYNYDYVLNLSAMKHVRSERDLYTLMRLIEVNILNTVKNINMLGFEKLKKYFCVSTDKAANPVNMMGASKRIMELFLCRSDLGSDISTARFANVAFSDGSLLHGFSQRIMKRQPISAPLDVQRYFVTPQESGELCLISCLLGEHKEIYFPKLKEKNDLLTFSEIAENYLLMQGYEVFLCDSEEEARGRADELIASGKWPCYFFKSDTTGEKHIEEFFSKNEKIDFERYSGIGIVKLSLNIEPLLLDKFMDKILEYRSSGKWDKEKLVDEFKKLVPNFRHEELGTSLDGKM